MGYWTMKKTAQRKATDYWPAKVKPLMQFKITYFWAVKKGPIPIKRKMQCRIAEVHAPQRIYGDTPRMVTASGWDSLRSQELYREFNRGRPKLVEAPLGKRWHKCSEQMAPWCGHSSVRLGLEDLPHIPAGSCSRRAGTSTRTRSTATSAACATGSAGPQASPHRTRTWCP